MARLVSARKVRVAEMKRRGSYAYRAAVVAAVVTGCSETERERGDVRHDVTDDCGVNKK